MIVTGVCMNCNYEFGILNLVLDWLQQKNVHRQQVDQNSLKEGYEAVVRKLAGSMMKLVVPCCRAKGCNYLH